MQFTMCLGFRNSTNVAFVANIFYLIACNYNRHTNSYNARLFLIPKLRDAPKLTY